MENDQNFSNYIDVNDCLKNKSYLELSRKHSDKKLEDNKPNILSNKLWNLKGTSPLCQTKSINLSILDGIIMYL